MLLNASVTLLLGLVYNARALAVPRAAAELAGTAAANVQAFEFSPPQFNQCPVGASLTPLDKDKDVYDAEARWVEGRQKVVQQAWQAYLTDHAVDASYYQEAPRVAIAVSGGGYRSMLNAAGVLKAMDSRTSEFRSHGILDMATYTAGLSGGAWFLGSMHFHEFPTVDDWVEKIDLSDHIFLPGFSSANGISTVQKNHKILKEYITKKAEAGFGVSLTDYWAGFSAYSLLNWTDDALNFRLTDLRDRQEIREHSAPLPIFLSLEIKADEQSLLNNTKPFEWGIFSTGSYVRDMAGMVDTGLVGTELDKGKPVNESACVDGLATLQYVLGTSSAAFMASIPSLVEGTPVDDSASTSSATESDSKPSAQGLPDMFNVLPGSFLDDMLSGLGELGMPLPLLLMQLPLLIRDILSLFNTPSEENGERAFEPPAFANPFKDLTSGSSEVSSAEDIYLGDGGLSRLGIPLLPFYVPARKVDVVFAVDGLADRTILYNGEKAHLPDGYDLAQQAKYMKQQGWAFPEVPTAEQFAECDYALTKRISFFGCNQLGTSTIVYIPNRLMLDVNTAFGMFKMQYSGENITNIVENGYRQLSDEATNKCIACLLLSRSNPGVPASMECQKCFADFCWSNATPLSPADCPV